MALQCPSCGDEDVVVAVSNGKETTYCQSCGFEGETTAPIKHVAPIIDLNRAAILKKLKSPQPPPQQKKPKQLRDRTDYTKARRAR